jgi:hypothetical protein
MLVGIEQVGARVGCDGCRAEAHALCETEAGKADALAGEQPPVVGDLPARDGRPSISRRDIHEAIALSPAEPGAARQFDRLLQRRLARCERAHRVQVARGTRLAPDVRGHHVQLARGRGGHRSVVAAGLGNLAWLDRCRVAPVATRGQRARGERGSPHEASGNGADDVRSALR